MQHDEYGCLELARHLLDQVDEWRETAGRESNDNYRKIIHTQAF